MNIRLRRQTIGGAILLGLACVAVCGCATSRTKAGSSEPPRTPQEIAAEELARLQDIAEAPSASAKDFYALGNALFDGGKVEEAAIAFQQCIARDPNGAAAYCNLALCYRRLGRVTDALAAYRQSLALDPENTITLNNFSLALELAGNWEELVETRTALARLEPDNVRRYSDLGLALLQAERYDEAAGAFEKVLELDPGYSGDYYNLGLCYFNLEDWDRALMAWLTAMAHNPTDEAVRRGLAVVYWKRGENDVAWKAVSDCQSMAIRLDPDFIAQLQEDSGQLGPK